MYLLDTNHCSAILDGNINIRSKLQNYTLDIVTCPIVVGELIYMVENSRFKEDNLKAVNNLLADLNVLSIDKNVARVYGEIKANLLKKYGPKENSKRNKYEFKRIGVSDNDLWIASIAVNYKAIIVSKDSDFDRIRSVTTFKLESWI